jgi:hypothetical protein
MNVEDRLRGAITRRTSGVEVSPDARQRIEEQLMQTQTDRNRQRWMLALGAAAAAVAVVVGLVAVAGDDDQVDTATTATTEATTSTEATTTTTEPSTTTTTFDAGVDVSQAVFPDPSTSRRFDDPHALVDSFARDYVGMDAPVVGDLMAGDGRSGEIEVRGSADGAPTTVLVRQLQDDTWFVIGAVTESIQPATPEPGASVSSPVPLTGQAYAFEGTVGVRLHVDGTAEPVVRTFVTGRGDGVLGDYEGELEYEAPTTAGTYGTILYTSEGGESGSPIAFALTRVQLR